MTMLKFVVVLICLCTAASGSQSDLEVLDDDGLLNLFRTEKYVVVLFSEYLSPTTPTSPSSCRQVFLWDVHALDSSQKPLWFEVVQIIMLVSIFLTNFYLNSHL